MSCIRCKQKSDTKICQLCRAKANLTRSIPWCSHNLKRNQCALCDPKGFIDFVFCFLMKTCQTTDTKKGHHFDLDLDWLYKMLNHQQGLCYHCKTFMAISKGSKDRTQISIDRVDNSQGHCKGNVVLTCLGCNLVKKDKDFSEFRSSEDQVLKPGIACEGPDVSDQEAKLAELQLEILHAKRELRFLQDLKPS